MVRNTRPDEPVEVNHRVQHRYPDGIKFCALCGGPMRWRTVMPDARRHKVCDRCGFVAFVEPKLVAGCLVEVQGQVLLLRRGIEPALGRWTFPGGYVELGESPIDAATRETHEEVGLEVAPKGLLGVYWNGQKPRVIVVVYLMELISGEPKPSPEALEVCYFARGAIPWAELAFQTTRNALRDWYARSA